MKDVVYESMMRRMMQSLPQEFSGMNDKQHRYDKAYMKMAQAFAELSQAERAKVGCIIVSPEGQIISQGFNGMPSGMDNCCEHEEEGKLVSNKEVLHAESNAITKCAKWGGKTDGSTIYVTLSPCLDCAKLIIQAGIKRVVYGEKYHNTEGIDLLKRVGVQVEQITSYRQTCKIMDFRNAIKALYEGKKVRLPEWEGYWFVENGLICVHTKDGRVTETPWLSEYAKRNDWEEY